MQINDPSTFSNIGHVDYICVDNCLVTGKFEISNFIVNNRIYEFNWNKVKPLLESSHKNTLTTRRKTV